jgi:hypothetical protein
MMEIEARITNTGPIGATLNAMTVDIIGPEGVFGKLNLDKIKLQPSGTDLHVKPQRIGVVDHDAFQAFVKSIQLDERTTLTLLNPAAKVSAMFLSTTANFRKTVETMGMNGPKVEIVETVRGEKDDGTFKNTIKITNPSPLEIYIPESVFHYVDQSGKVVAEQYGEFDIVRGTSYHELEGKITAGKASGELSLVGMEVLKDSWMKRTIKYFKSEQISLPPTLADMVA